jgi:hypothetical protein
MKDEVIGGRSGRGAASLPSEISAHASPTRTPRRRIVSRCTPVTRSVERIPEPMPDERSGGTSPANVWSADRR